MAGRLRPVYTGDGAVVLLKKGGKLMLVAERYEKIVQLVNDRGSIRVTELSELCGVTEETIRRDLDRWSRQASCGVPTAAR